MRVIALRILLFFTKNGMKFRNLIFPQKVLRLFYAVDDNDNDGDCCGGDDDDDEHL